MIKLITDYPIAVESDDHIHPDGIYLDNNQKRFLLETTIQKIGASAR